MGLRPAWTLDRLRSTDLGVTRVCAGDSVRARVRAALPWPLASPEDTLPAELETLIVVGGGTLIDHAKFMAKRRKPPLRLIAVPSIWGSGAEASPVVVVDDNGRKEIVIGPQYVPDERVVWPELAQTVPPARARAACGDAWAHVLEGALSPLASEELQSELAAVMRDMLALPLAADGRWFDPSARACEGQSRSSVGLVHGIAHTVEAPLRATQTDADWGHAKLCATFLWPVMELNRGASDKWRRLAGRHGLDEAAVFAVLRDLFDREAYRRALSVLVANWRAVLRDPCTRTNSALVRPLHLEHFRSAEFA